VTALRAALERVVERLQEGDTDAAETLLDGVLAEEPDQADAWHLRGVLLHQRGYPGAAVAAIRRALTLLPPDHPVRAGMWNNLGNVLLESGALEDAATAYRESLALAPDTARTWTNLATLQRRLGRLDEASEAARAAVRADPDDAEGWYALSRALIESGQVHDGLVAHSEAVTRWPAHDVGRDQVLRALVLLGRREEAAALYRDWLAVDPGNAVAIHQLAACSEGDTPPPRASDAYIETVFDSYAASFDAKLAGLGYRAPDLVAAALRRARPVVDASLDVADLGCGTGLCGPLLRPWARRLVGCDLSTGMLQQAQRRAVYDSLFKVEIVDFLEHEPASFDLLACADTLCYFGDLQAFADAAAGALRVGGVLVLTVEALQDGGDAPFRLEASGRYAHSRAHLVQVLAGDRWAEVSIEPDALRQEAGLPVAGYVVTARRRV
jgi:predicted TPR repeat methyltransferase